MNQVLSDLRTKYPTPDFSAQQQSIPGSEQAMEPRADHGEQSYVGNNKLRGLVAVVTGGDSGIGRAVALAFAREGANVLFTYLDENAIKKGIRVNGIAPGPVWTPLIPSTMPSEKVKTFGSNTLFERPAQPAELAPLYVFLASDDANYITGEIYGVTGGRKQL